MENNCKERRNETTNGEKRCNDVADRNRSNINMVNYITRLSQASRSTLAIILSRRRATSSSIRSESIFLDNNYPNYNWLLPGWLVEERHMDTGRIYKYFYDPVGSLYYSRAQVLNAWDQSGLVVLDDD
ncbi:hypothetical protein LWI29_008314 [Acer saccharum]|uniref:MBD domain-containing protein n=1 Tax=Acer saccharum TaxID=4024 RepID=A0AA39RXS2_ACESA|nr:hypothetical protein LWI29_008314 [Acer saccharum]KAK1561828.1 hypothetical protein Q3G72_001422 [Acer saccharum]